MGRLALTVAVIWCLPLVAFAQAWVELTSVEEGFTVRSAMSGPPRDSVTGSGLSRLRMDRVEFV